jgi:hypothetical protein
LIEGAWNVPHGHRRSAYCCSDPWNKSRLRALSLHASAEHFNWFGPEVASLFASRQAMDAKTCYHYSDCCIELANRTNVDQQARSVLQELANAWLEVAAELERRPVEEEGRIGLCRRR